MAAALAGVVLVTGIVGLWLYEPLSWGGYVGPGGGSGGANATIVQDDLFGSTAVLFDGPTAGTATVVYSIRNDGHLPVTVHAQGPDEDLGLAVDVRWAPVPSPAAAIGGVRPDPKVTSLRVGPGEDVAMWVTVAKPACDTGTGARLDRIPIHWSVLGVPKDQQFELSPDHVPPIVLCKP